MKLIRVFALVCLLGLVGSSPELRAELRLPPIVGDNMVLQRGEPVPLWGWDTPGTEIVVSLNDNKVSAKADASGKWLARLPAMKAGGPYELNIQGSTSRVLKNVLIGEVWLCSGQSNMEWTVLRSANPQEEIAKGNHPQIRHIKIPHIPAKQPQDDVKSDGWKVCTPDNVAQFTAVGYYFARELQKELNVPIGIIGSNWGGTRIEPWTPPEGFQAIEGVKEIDEISNNLANYPTMKANNQINHQSALALYNGMIHPLLPYGIRGAIWYQGESNNGEGMLYHDKMKALIAGWRKVWNKPELPFYFVQLAPFKYGGDPERLPGIWEAQLATLSVPHTGMAVTVDIGNISDIHPKNKQDVGKRLALWALAQDYGKSDLVYSGPLYKSMKVEGNKARIAFDHVGGGLQSRDGEPLSHFAVKGESGDFVDAEATIDGDTVLVWSDQIEKPTAVRFGWHQTAEPNLSNKEGLPASPFRTK